MIAVGDIYDFEPSDLGNILCVPVQSVLGEYPGDLVLITIMNHNVGNAENVLDLTGNLHRIQNVIPSLAALRK